MVNGYKPTVQQKKTKHKWPLDTGKVAVPP